MVALCLLSLLSCSKGQPELTAEDLAGEKFSEGAKVKAPLGKRKKQKATVLEVYGKLAKLRFADTNIGWALLKDVEPQGAVSHPPKDDTCSAAVGDRVQARWSTARTFTNGTVDEVYGKLAHIQFDDKDVDWAVCADLKPMTESDSDEGGGSESGVSEAVTQCKRACNSNCKGAKNKAKCVGECRRACD
ncbi:hypothetical protein A176_005196 [Myxococcus hansupus]|uniref:Uncharacterized protein n=2 Tax=Pseudomyxococcus hansupus TaxID=1297742 RepID=A0A0H4WZP3_9BACT|nr:hypothetical protein A176_005196 [Myxococcus hansupus]